MTDTTTEDVAADVTEQPSDEQAILGLPEAGPVYSLQQFPEKLAVVKLPAGAEIPSWAESSSLFSVTATATETSVVCAGRDVPTKVIAQRGLTAFAVQEAPGHELAGFLVSLLGPLAEAGLSVFTITTHDTVWILVKVADAEQAAAAWQDAGHSVVVAIPVKPARKGKGKPSSKGKAKQ